LYIFFGEDGGFFIMQVIALSVNRKGKSFVPGVEEAVSRKQGRGPIKENGFSLWKCRPEGNRHCRKGAFCLYSAQSGKKSTGGLKILLFQSNSYHGWAEFSFSAKN
jgi:hypothetical protein